MLPYILLARPPAHHCGGAKRRCSGGRGGRDGLAQDAYMQITCTCMYNDLIFFTPAGTPYPSALSFIRKLAHSGDKIDSSVGRDAPRFHHECTSATFLTPTHTAHTIHMCTASVARISAAALRNYARSRAIGHSLTANTISRPAVVQAPF